MPEDEEQQVAASFEALGRFVQAFEDMVNEARNACLMILSEPKPKWQALVNIALHHRVMTAQPLMDIMQGIFGTMLDDPDTRATMKEVEIHTFEEVLKQIRKDYDALVNKRNELLHGTWTVGLSGDHGERAHFRVVKRRPSAKGMKYASLPTTAEELLALCRDCDIVERCINWVHSAYGFRTTDLSITKLFRFDSGSGKWIPAGPDTFPAT
jgi:hypothetical protein